MSTVISAQERRDAYSKVFGGVNGGATKRVSQENGNKNETYQEMRVGKTRRDKANGHVPYVKNRRVWQNGAPAGKNGKAVSGSTGSWVKVNG